MKEILFSFIVFIKIIVCLLLSKDDMQIVEDERRKWTEAMEAFSNFNKDLDAETKKFQPTSQKIKDTNKAYDNHVKQQAKAITTIENPTQQVSAMSELTEITKLIDSNREQMTKQAEHMKNVLCFKVTSRCAHLLNTHVMLCNTMVKMAPPNTSKWKAEPPVGPAVTWPDTSLPSVTLPEPSPLSQGSSQSQGMGMPLPAISKRSSGMSDQQQQQPPYTFESRPRSSTTEGDSRTRSATVIEKQYAPTQHQQWDQYFTPEGHPYWFNPATGVTTWNDPNQSV